VFTSVAEKVHDVVPDPKTQCSTPDEWLSVTWMLGGKGATEAGCEFNAMITPPTIAATTTTAMTTAAIIAALAPPLIPDFCGGGGGYHGCGDGGWLTNL
jgi:hypothetical protein